MSNAVSKVVKLLNWFPYLTTPSIQSPVNFHQEESSSFEMTFNLSTTNQLIWIDSLSSAL